MGNNGYSRQMYNSKCPKSNNCCHEDKDDKVCKKVELAGTKEINVVTKKINVVVKKINAVMKITTVKAAFVIY